MVRLQGGAVVSGDQWLVIGGALVAGLVGSPHCVAMCGPIVSGLIAPPCARGSAAADLWGYHVGRLWTYSLLGLVAGIAGSRIQGLALGQRWVTGVFGACVLLIGLSLLRTGESPRVGRFLAPLLERLGRSPAWRRLADSRGFLPRLLLGALLGLMPCGMVWAMLLPAAALPTPWHAGLAMVAFGLGTVPMMSAVVLLARRGLAWKRRGWRVVAVLIALAGLWMIGRAVVGDGSGHADHAAHGHRAASSALR